MWADQAQVVVVDPAKDGFRFLHARCVRDEKAVPLEEWINRGRVEAGLPPVKLNLPTS